MKDSTDFARLLEKRFEADWSQACGIFNEELELAEERERSYGHRMTSKRAAQVQEDTWEMLTGWLEPARNPVLDTLPELTQEQAAALAKVLGSRRRAGIYLALLIKARGKVVKREDVKAEKVQQSCGYLNRFYITEELPDYSYTLGGEEKPPKRGKAWWSGNNPPPSLGSRVDVRINNFGPGTVRAYFIEHGWLGVEVELDKRPEWHVEANGDEHPWVMVFGCELEREPARREGESEVQP